MRSRREIIEEYNEKVDCAGNGITGDLKLIIVSSRIIIELLLDIRDTVNNGPGSPYNILKR